MSSSPDQEDVDNFEDALEDLPVEKQTVSKKSSSLLGTNKEKVARKLSRFRLKDKTSKNGATESEEAGQQMSLSESIEESHLAVEMFLNNNFDEARNIVQPLADRSIYHALGYSVFMYLKAVMTFEEKHIEEASIVLSDACDTINQFRRKTGLVERILSSSSNGGSPYDSWTETEVHAELCYAEVLLLRAVLTLCEDETLVSFVKAGLKVRTCYQSFRECWTILNQRNWDDAQNKHDFESGVRMGVGSFNLMISMLPARVMRLLEFIGFGGNKAMYLLMLLVLGFATRWSHQSNSKSNLHCQKPGDTTCSDTSIETVFIDESLTGLDQEDPILIEAIKKLIVNPPDKNIPYHLSDTDDQISMGGQWGQASFLVKMFGFKKRDGFFIEAGAHNGEEASNTLYFEKKLGWKGILVEPNPDTFKDLLAKKRKAFAFGHCLSTKTYAEVVDFDVAGMYGGIINDGKKLSDESIIKEFQHFENLRVDTRTIRMQCFPLYSLIQAVGNPTIDVLSLDIEGGEFPVLKTIPWEKVDIKVLLVEVNRIGAIFDGTKKDFEEFLDQKGYKFVKSVAIDNIYAKKDFQVPQNLI